MEQELPDFQQFCEEFGLEPTAWQYKAMAVLLKNGSHRYTRGGKQRTNRKIMELLAEIPPVIYLPKPESE